MQGSGNNDGWGEKFLGSTRGRVLALLRGEGKSVNELAAELELTDNAVRAHLTALERDGLIRRQGVRRGFRKPEQVYTVTQTAAQFFPRAHELLLAQLVTVLKDRDADSARDILTEVGRRIGSGYAAGVDKSKGRVDIALKALADIGGVVELSTTGKVSTIRGAGCPLVALTRLHPEVCALATALLSEILGVDVVEACERGDSPRCRFSFTQRAA